MCWIVEVNNAEVNIALVGLGGKKFIEIRKMPASRYGKHLWIEGIKKLRPSWTQLNGCNRNSLEFETNRYKFPPHNEWNANYIIVIIIFCV